MADLLVNIDHVATLRNARGETEPNPLKAAQLCIQHGAKGIVFHLREDRRHIKDEDVYAISTQVDAIIDFEMAATQEMLGICEQVSPHICTLVPEKRAELTTEGGLDMKKLFSHYKNDVVPRLQDKGIELSLFLDPEEEDITLAAELGVEAVELHTGPYANAKDAVVIQTELNRLTKAAELIHQLGMKVNAGHGLNFVNIHPFLSHVPHLNDISIGHAMIADSVYRGLPVVVQEMKSIISSYTL